MNSNATNTKRPSSRAVATSSITKTVATTYSTPYKELIVEYRERVLVIKFNRISVRNALNRRAYYEIIRALTEARNDPRITIIVITGIGETFSAGNDLTQLQQYADADAFFRSANYVLKNVVKAFLYCRKVLVALVNGACIGIGFTLCALCDVVYCVDTAYFQAPFTQLGLCPEACSTYLMPLVLGRTKATEILCFGEKLSAAEALELRFVSRIYQMHQLDTLIWPKIMQYSLLPAESLLISKKLLREPERGGMLKALQAECNELEKLRYGEVYLNAIETFLKKRKQNKSKL